jgi:hypothetical protein
MLVTTEEGEKLGIFHLSKVLRTRYCQPDGAGGSLRLKFPQQDSIAEYLVSQVGFYDRKGPYHKTDATTEQAALRTLAVWPWDINNAKEAEFSAWLREALTIAIEEGDAEINTVSSHNPLAEPDIDGWNLLDSSRNHSTFRP